MPEKAYVKIWLSYESYFEQYSAAEVGRLVLAMMRYRASGAEPEFSGSERYIWPAIKRDIDESVKAQAAADNARRENGKLGGRPPASNNNLENLAGFSETEKTYGKGQGQGQGQTLSGNSARGAQEPPKVSDYGFSPELEAAVTDWLTYKQERRESYKPTGLKSMLTQIQKAAAEYGNAAVIDIIRDSMASGYQGIVFDRLKRGGNAGGAGRNTGESAKPKRDWGITYDV